ncbi:MAG TPA: DNA-3-methyladenine glycosylase [Chitinophagaceae bacterium]|nr:DNA-3-methyladenine glycosylase [Chitinophagaceae bacterium]
MKRNSAIKISKHSAFAAMKRVDAGFYSHADVITVAKLLLGKILVTNINNIITAGRIVETEAYNGIGDKASHAYGGRRTARTEVMYGGSGLAYVYLCYGIHHLFNIVTGRPNVPEAILIRAVEPLYGIEDMLLRTDKKKLDNTLTRGPGNLSKALGISVLHTGTHLAGDDIFLMQDDKQYKPAEIGVSPRIGVDYAAEDALLPYRFYIKGNAYVSGKIK